MVSENIQRAQQPKCTSPRTICVLGCAGFIGSHLLDRLISDGTYNTIGIDITSDKIVHHIGNKQFEFITINVHDTDAIRPYIQRSDIVISLVALCNPSLYNTIPLDVIDANFTKPLELARMCAEEGKWLIQFSTSEVYGKSVEGLIGEQRWPQLRYFSEDSTPLILGPIHAQRWSYACAKQLLERTIYAYGFEKDLQFTIVRPFNFIGAQMDYLPELTGSGLPRVIACFMNGLLFNKPLSLVDGGKNKRCFTYISDAIDALIAIIDHESAAKGQIFNIGHPENEISIVDLAHTMAKFFCSMVPQKKLDDIVFKDVSSPDFYGPGYEDSDRRIPDISKITSLTGWTPHVPLEKAIEHTVKSFVDDYWKE